jgi:hypothetical protein
MMPLTEPMLTIRPCFLLLMEKITDRQELKTPVRSVSMTSCHSSGFIVRRSRSRVIPALFTRP